MKSESASKMMSKAIVLYAARNIGMLGGNLVIILVLFVCGIVL